MAHLVFCQDYLIKSSCQEWQRCHCAPLSAKKMRSLTTAAPHSFTHQTLLPSQAAVWPLPEVRGHLHRPHLQMREWKPCKVPTNAFSCYSVASHTEDQKMQTQRGLCSFLSALRHHACRYITHKDIRSFRFTHKYTHTHTHTCVRVLCVCVCVCARIGTFVQISRGSSTYVNIPTDKLTREETHIEIHTETWTHRHTPVSNDKT